MSHVNKYNFKFKKKPAGMSWIFEALIKWIVKLNG